MKLREQVSVPVKEQKVFKKDFMNGWVHTPQLFNPEECEDWEETRLNHQQEFSMYMMGGEL